MKSLLLFLIRRIYQPISRHLLPKSCRFTPTCSEYTAQAIEKYGFFRGSWKGICRICRCNPWRPGGEDPLT